MMTAFYQKRAQKHQNKMMRYLKYVFNDHFIVVCGFVLSGLALYYADVVKTLTPAFYLGKPLVILAWLFAISTGRLATLAEEADKVFLLPKETQMKGYFVATLKRSAWLPMVVCLLVSGITMPLLVATGTQVFSEFMFYLPLLLLLKSGQLFNQIQELFQVNQGKERRLKLIWLIGSLVSMLLSLYVVAWSGLIVAAVLALYLYLQMNQTFAEGRLDWEKMIQHEKSRLRRIYQFINLFTDVPGISSSVKRRKIFDGLLEKIKKNQKNTYLYLYSRSFVRGTEYSGLYLRLIGVVAVLLIFVSEFWITLGISLVFIYLIGFQLIPIYSQFDYMVMTNLYPVEKAGKKQAVAKLISWLLAGAGVIFSLLAAFTLPSWSEVAMVLVALAVEIYLFTRFYLPQRLKNLQA